MGFVKPETACAFAFAVALLCSGCAIPVKRPQVRGPGSVLLNQRIDLGFLKEGVTHRAEVMKRIGWLDTGFKSDQLFVGRWLHSEHVVYWAVVAPGGGGGAGADRKWAASTLLVGFDEGGLVERFALVKDRDLAKTVADWISRVPPLVLESPIEFEIVHVGKLKRNHWGYLRLTSDALQFREVKHRKHDFSLPRTSLRSVDFRGAAKLGVLRHATEVEFDLLFQEKTAVGKHATLVADFPVFLALLQYANLGISSQP